VNVQTPAKQISKIAIGMACYKPNIDFFCQQLKSIQDQAFSEWRCFICFDSDLSEIRSQTALKPFFDEPRFHFIQNLTQLGVTKNFEETINQAIISGYSFDAFAFSDQDDIWLSQKLETSAAALVKAPPLSAVHSDSFLLIHEGQQMYRAQDTTWQRERRIVEDCTMSDLMVRNVATGGSMLVDTELIKMYRRIPIAYHDWWFAIVAAAKGGLYPIHESLYEYRQHEGNFSGAAAYSSFFVDNRRRKDLGKAVREKYQNTETNIKVTETDVYHFSLRESFLLGRAFGFGVGFGLFIKGLCALFRNRPLARSCWVCFAGQILSTFR
jgi:hypothetical protein